MPWIYAIARRTRVDHYRRNRRVVAHELSVEPLPEPVVRFESFDPPPTFETLVAALPAGEREVVTLLKVSDIAWPRWHELLHLPWEPSSRRRIGHIDD